MNNSINLDIHSDSSTYSQKTPIISLPVPTAILLHIFSFGDHSTTASTLQVNSGWRATALADLNKNLNKTQNLLVQNEFLTKEEVAVLDKAPAYPEILEKLQSRSHIIFSIGVAILKKTPTGSSLSISGKVSEAIFQIFKAEDNKWWSDQLIVLLEISHCKKQQEVDEKNKIDRAYRDCCVRWIPTFQTTELEKVTQVNFQEKLNRLHIALLLANQIQLTPQLSQQYQKILDALASTAMQLIKAGSITKGRDILKKLPMKTQYCRYACEVLLKTSNTSFIPSIFNPISDPKMRTACKGYFLHEQLRSSNWNSIAVLLNQEGFWEESFGKEISCFIKIKEDLVEFLTSITNPNVRNSLFCDIISDLSLEISKAEQIAEMIPDQSKKADCFETIATFYVAAALKCENLVAFCISVKNNHSKNVLFPKLIGGKFFKTLSESEQVAEMIPDQNIKQESLAIITIFRGRKKSEDKHSQEPVEKFSSSSSSISSAQIIENIPTKPVQI